MFMFVLNGFSLRRFRSLSILNFDGLYPKKWKLMMAVTYKKGSGVARFIRLAMVDRWRFLVHSDWVGGSLGLPIVRIFTILRKNLNRYRLWGIPNWFIDTSVWVLSHLSHQKVRLVMKCRILFLDFFLLLLVSPVQYVFIGLVLEMPNTRHHEQCPVYCGISLSTGLISLYLYKEIVTTPEIVTHFHTGSETRLNNLSNNPSNSKL